MKKSISKKIVSLFLAVMMLVSSIPAVAYASTEWTQIASSDFTYPSGTDVATGTCWGTGTTNGNYTYFTGSQAKTLSDTDNAMSWNVGLYAPSSSAISVSPNGSLLPCGYMYLTNYTGSTTTPVTGLDCFKVDIGFSFNQNFSISGTNNYCFFKLGTYPTLGMGTEDMWKNNVFAQDAYGRVHIGGDGFTSGGANFSITTDSRYLTTGVEYHYVMTYSNGYVRTYITDADGDLITNIYGGKHTLDTSSINNVLIGSDDNDYFMDNVRYKSVTFYSGAESGKEDVSKDGSKTKYLFAYFTGQNNSDGEKIRFAVSDDGLSWEALNGNQPILNNTPDTFYPSNGNSLGKAASGYARDPYIIQKRNPDGSIAQGYYVLATDLQVGGSDYSNSKFLIWSIDDFTQADTAVPWSVETTPWFPNTGGSASNYYAWAPEAIWVDSMSSYMILWSGGDTGYDDLHIYYAFTKDFKTYTNLKGETLGGGAEPSRLIEPGWKCIDGTMQYDGQFYYLYFKNESEQQIYYAVSENPYGPFSTPVKFSDSDYTNGCEGPEIYQLNDGSYILMMDYYSSNGTFLSYAGTKLDSFSTTPLGTNINHLSPRHGAVTYITDAELNDLTAKYGKSTYDITGLTDGTAVNDTLVARYFVNQDVTADATGHGYTLTNAGTGATAQILDGKTSAAFVSNSATAGSNQDAGSYMYIDTNKMYTDYNLNEKDGVTFDWYGYANSCNMGRFFEISNAAIGELTWDTRYNKPYAYTAANREFGASGSIASGYNVSSGNNAWHHYTVTITNGYINSYVDGVLERSVYSKGSQTTIGSPLGAGIDATWFANAFGAGQLRFSASVFSGDALLDGNISDFRIYNRALSYDDIVNSINSLSDSDHGKTPAEGVSADFYDPMEDKDIDGDGNLDKTKYDGKTVTDDVYGEVLNITGGVATHNPTGGYTAKASSSGYTISCFYNTGDSNTGSTIFSIGRKNSVDSANRQYLELLDNGQLYYNWEVNGSPSFIDITDAFGDTVLSEKTWYHITLQVVPAGKYDDIYIYINGNLVKKIDTYNNSYTSKGLVEGRSIHEFFTMDHDVTYGVGCGYWPAATDGRIDEFKIYCDYYNASELFANDNNAIADKLIDLAKEAYASAMSNIADKPYTNMSAAYDAYDAVCRYADAMKHGRDSEGNPLVPNPAEIVSLYRDLTTAINNMKPYEGPETINGYSSANNGGLGDVSSDYASNLLSYPNLSTSIKHDTTGAASIDGENATYKNSSNQESTSGQIRVALGGFVWLYKGTASDLKAPTTNGWYSKGKRGCDIYARNMFITSGDISLNQNWMYMGSGNSTSTEMWSNPTSTTTGIGVSSSSTSPQYQIAKSTAGIISANNTWYNFSNYVTYTGSMADDQYITSFTPAASGTLYSNWTGGNGSWAIPMQKLNDIYVINYIPVQNALNDADRLEVLKNITDYTPASMKALTDAYDALTSLNYISEINNSTSNANALAAKLDEYVKALTGVDLDKLELKADYQPALDAADAEKSFMESVTIDPNTGVATYVDIDGVEHKYTISSWTAYESAVNAIRDHFASLNPWGSDEQYVTDNNQITTFITHIADAKKFLVELADYNPVDEAISHDSASLKYATNNVNSNGQIYAYGTWKSFSEAYPAAEYWHLKDNAYRYDTSYYQVDYALNAGGPYIAYDAQGNIVTSDDQVIDHYTYLGVFYDSADDAHPSQFETGDFVKIDGVTTQLNGHRYYVSAIYNPATVGDNYVLSDAQDSINTTGQNLIDTNDALDFVADYTAFDATIDLLKYQDVAAFSDDYLASGNSIYDTLDVEGVPTAQQPFSTGVPTANAELVTTPGYSVNNTAYVNADNVIYKNTGESYQDILDATTTRILTALQTINNDDTADRRHYKVTFRMFSNETGAEVQVGTDTVTSAYYGQTVTEAVPEGYTAYKWLVTSNGTTMTIPAGTSYTANIQSDVVIEAYCSNDADTSDNVKVQIQNIYGNTVQEYSVAESTSLVLADGAYTIGDTSTVTLATIPLYAFNGWNINGAAVNNGSYTLADVKDANGTVVLTPKYVNTSAAYVITVDGTGITADDGTELRYDSAATATKADGAYALAILNPDQTYSVVTYDSEYKFFAPGSAAFYSITAADGVYTVNGTEITDADMIRKLDAKLPFVYSIDSNEGGKYTVYSGVTVGTMGGKIIEVGTVYSDTANTADSLVIGGDNVYSLIAKKPVSTQQYYIRFNTTKAVNARAYVKYSFDTTVEREDEYSQGTKVQTIDYGNICSKSAS